MNEYKLAMLPPSANLETNAVLKALAGASRALAELKGYADTIPNKHILTKVARSPLPLLSNRPQKGCREKG